jgi:hypothetical protein
MDEALADVLNAVDDMRHHMLGLMVDHSSSQLSKVRKTAVSARSQRSDVDGLPTRA